jgi:hypothetical protein
MIGYKSILPIYYYTNQNDVISQIKENIINPVESWLEAKKNQISSNYKTTRELELEKQIEFLKEELRDKKML